MRKRRTEVMVETHRLLAIRRSPAPRGWCEQCARDVDRATPEEAAAIARVNVRTIYRRLEEGNLHFVERSGGEVWICLQSL